MGSVKAVVYYTKAHHLSDVVERPCDDRFHEMWGIFLASAHRAGLHVVHLTCGPEELECDERFRVDGPDPEQVVLAREQCIWAYLRRQENNDWAWFIEPDSYLFKEPPEPDFPGVGTVLLRRAGDVPTNIPPGVRFHRPESWGLVQRVAEIMDAHPKAYSKVFHGDVGAWHRVCGIGKEHPPAETAFEGHRIRFIDGSPYGIDQWNTCEVMRNFKGGSKRHLLLPPGQWPKKMRP